MLFSYKSNILPSSAKQFLDIKILGTLDDGFDFAILELADEINTSSNDYVDIVHLPEPNSRCPIGKILVASGWGRDKLTSGVKRNILWAVFQECLPKRLCIISDAVKSYTMCVGDLKNHLNNGFKGDSGGNMF